MLRKIVAAALALWCLTAGPAFAHVGLGHVGRFRAWICSPLEWSRSHHRNGRRRALRRKSWWPQSLVGAVSLCRHDDLWWISRLWRISSASG